MNAVVVDTDVFSFIFKGDSRGHAYRPHLDGNVVALSFMSVAELYRWAFLRNWGIGRWSDLRTAIAKLVMVEPDDALCQIWAELMSGKGWAMSPADAWIAATALRMQVPLVTHNGADFRKVPDLKVLCES
jgi:tRNA(fMet)-specific endonuclease VapC